MLETVAVMRGPPTISLPHHANLRFTSKSATEARRKSLTSKLLFALPPIGELQNFLTVVNVECCCECSASVCMLSVCYLLCHVSM